MYGRGKLYGRAISACKGFTQSLHKLTCAVKEGNAQRLACVPLLFDERDGGRRTLHVVAVVARLYQPTDAVARERLLSLAIVKIKILQYITIYNIIIIAYILRLANIIIIL